MHTGLMTTLFYEISQVAIKVYLLAQKKLLLAVKYRNFISRYIGYARL